MIVDPATGEIISLSTTAQSMAEGYDPSSMTGAAGISAAQSMGVADSTPLRMMENIPGITSTMGWNTVRSGNTIMYGGYGRFGANPANNVASMFRQGAAGFGTNPRAFGRFSSVDAIDSTNSKVYSPFQFAARSGDAIAKKVVASAYTNKANLFSNSERIEKRQRRHKRLGIDPDNPNQEYFSRGTLARINAGSRLSKLGTMSSEMAGNSANFLRSSNPALMRAAIDSGYLGPGITGRQAGNLTMMSGRGVASQYVGGYISGAGRLGGPVRGLDETLLKGGQKAALAGRVKAANHLAGAGLYRDASGVLRLSQMGGSRLGMNTGAKAGASIAGKAITKAGFGAGSKAAGALLASTAGIPVVNVVAGAVTTAMMVYDLTQMAIEGAIGVANLAKDAGVSMKGSIDKGVMGMGYQDNTVAATSRARGVHAIANSRLNARSVLGQEAAALHSHFG